jgi:hypothetical protein
LGLTPIFGTAPGRRLLMTFATTCLVAGGHEWWAVGAVC